MVAAAFGREHRGLRGAALRAAGAGAEQQGEGKGGGGARRNSDHAATVASPGVWIIVLWYQCSVVRRRPDSCENRGDAHPAHPPRPSPFQIGRSSWRERGCRE